MSAGEKKLMHCFAFTPTSGAAQADWDAFYNATDALPKKIHGISRVWYGKLENPLTVAGANGVKHVRQYGVCMEMSDTAALKAYENDPAHQAWLEVYEKVREAGTTTFNILGQ